MKKDKEMFIGTKCGQAIKIDTNTIEDFGLLGNKDYLIKTAKGDSVVSLVLYSPSKTKEIVFITKNGYGAKVRLMDIRVMGKGGSGVSFVKITPQSGLVFDYFGVGTKKTFTVVTNKNKISIPIGAIPTIKRGGRGVTIVKLAKGEKIIEVLV